MTSNEILPPALRTPSDVDSLTATQTEALGVMLTEVKRAADIDGHGDEGAGYDMAEFARQMIARGWSFEPSGIPVPLAASDHERARIWDEGASAIHDIYGDVVESNPYRGDND
jgi:hypothetical protein